MSIEMILEHCVKCVIRQNERKMLKKCADVKLLWYVTNKNKVGHSIFISSFVTVKFLVLCNNIEIGNESSNAPPESHINYDLYRIFAHAYILSHFNIVYSLHSKLPSILYT